MTSTIQGLGTFHANTIAVDVSTDGAINSGTSPATWSHTVGAGSHQVLIVSITCGGGTGNPTIDSVTFGSDTLTLVPNSYVDGGTGNHTAELWYKLNPTQQTATITVNYTTNGTVNKVDTASISLNGVEEYAITLFDSYAQTNNGNSTVITTIADNCFVIDIVGGSVLSGTATTNQTLIGTVHTTSTVSRFGSSYTLPATPAGNHTMSWNVTNGGFCQTVIALAPYGIRGTIQGIQTLTF